MFIQWMNVSTYLSFTCNYHITQLWFLFIWQIDFAIKLPANNSSGRFSHCLLVTKQVLLLRQHCETFTSGKPGPTVTVHCPPVLVSKLILHTDTERNNCPALLQILLLEPLTQETRTVQGTQPLVVDLVCFLSSLQHSWYTVGHQKKLIVRFLAAAEASECWGVLTSGDNKCPLTWLKAQARPTALGPPCSNWKGTIGRYLWKSG